jgi:hypothetical protein
MDPFAPVSGLSIERYAELSAEVSAARGDPLKIAEAIGRAGVSAADWERAQAAWPARLADPAIGLALAGPFESHHHAVLDRLLGPAPDVPLEDFAAMLGEALAAGRPAMAQRRGMDALAWSRTSYRSRAALAADPGRLLACLALAEQVAQRRLAEAIPVGPAAPAPAAADAPNDRSRVFDQDASVAARAVGKAVVSGFDAFGSALDSMGKSLLGPSVGTRVLAHWSDGNKYPGTVAQIGKGQILVTMADGSQHWIPEAFVKAV